MSIALVDICNKEVIIIIPLILIQIAYNLLLILFFLSCFTFFNFSFTNQLRFDCSTTIFGLQLLFKIVLNHRKLSHRYFKPQSLIHFPNLFKLHLIINHNLFPIHFILPFLLIERTKTVFSKLSIINIFLSDLLL